MIAVCVAVLYRLSIIYPSIPVSAMTRFPLSEEQLLAVVASNPNHAFAHQRLSELYVNSDDQLAEQHAVATLLNNPANGMAMMTLMQLAEAKNPSVAYQALQLGERLWPSHDYLHWHVANYWVRQDRLEKAMTAWDIVLQQESSKEFFSESLAARLVFPIFERLAKNKTTRLLFDDYMISRPYWWGVFYKHLQSQRGNYQVVNYFYNKMGEYRPRTKDEVDEYLDYLAMEGRWHKANQLWKSQYIDYKVGVKGLINNGGFESNSFNDLFNWNITEHQNVHTILDSYSFVEGKHSLKISLTGWISTYWGHVWQLFVLPQGRYQLKFKARASIDSVRGFKWRIACHGDAKKERLLAVSQEVNDSKDWKDYTMTFNIPNTKACQSQKLYLITAGSNKANQQVRGDVWFDAFSLRRL